YTTLFRSDYKVVFKIFQLSSTIARRISNNHILFRDDFHLRATVKSVQYYKRTIGFGKRETKHGCSFGRRYLGGYVMVCQIHAVVIRFRYFRFMRKPAGSVLFITYRFTTYRHKRELSVVVHPRGWLMRLF